jgi:hypothetical protein
VRLRESAKSTFDVQQRRNIGRVFAVYFIGYIGVNSIFLHAHGGSQYQRNSEID